MSTQRRSSRPTSAASYASRVGQTDNELKLECRAAFLGHYDDIREKIESKENLILLLQETGRNPTAKTISKYWTSKIESMTFDDFVDVCSREPVTTEEDLMKAFRKIDINGDGYISLDELLKIMTTRGEKMSRAEVKELIDEVDENKDGKLDYKEFAQMVLTTTKEYKKLALKSLEKKEKLKRRDGDVTPRRDMDDLSLGSQLSIQSSSSDMRRLSPDSSPEPSPDRRVSKHSIKNANSQERRLSKQSISGSGLDDVISVRSERRLSTRSHLTNDDTLKSSPRPGKDARPKSASKGGREPSNLHEWTSIHSKGSFFLDEESIISHYYNLKLTEDTDALITIQPLKIGESGVSLDGTVVDTALFILNKENNSFVAFTDSKDSKGKYSVHTSLSKGSYLLIPFTTGCRLKSKTQTGIKEAKLITKDKDDKIVLTRAFKKALEDIFEMADLDGNGLLSREEFNWYNLRTSGEEVADEEWQVVEDNIELERGEITRPGFIKLNEMEADDNDGDTDDLWITLTTMGFTKSLLLDEACPFLLKVYTQDCDDPKLKVLGLESHQEKIEKVVCDFAMAKGEATKVKGMKDLTMYQYTNDHRAIIVIDNKSKSKVKMSLDCSKRRGLVSHTGSLVATVTVPPQTAVVGHHILPLDDGGEFSVVCEESMLK
ncbi:unnamed protein product [Lymnaea stagnalis]|uniref:EF-hand domain-containing protein n=1 Tax=Lymnaea stagnalis TaxID=6523 RepID=A0AAV2IE89_LYMST